LIEDQAEKKINKKNKEKATITAKRQRGRGSNPKAKT